MNEQPTKRQALAMIARCLLLAGALTVSARILAQNRLNVTGMIIGSGNDPKGLARIEFSGPSQFVVMSDAAGHFVARDVLPGTYQVTVRQQGNYQRLIVKIETNNVNLKVNW